MTFPQIHPLCSRSKQGYGNCGAIQKCSTLTNTPLTGAVIIGVLDVFFAALYGGFALHDCITISASYVPYVILAFVQVAIGCMIFVGVKRKRANFLMPAIILKGFLLALLTAFTVLVIVCSFAPSIKELFDVHEQTLPYFGKVMKDSGRTLYSLIAVSVCILVMCFMVCLLSILCRCRKYLKQVEEPVERKNSDITRL
uniref:G_PROTEIN_RECEP_F1_2 domain-containing protein n=1 Tax=Steinernema glaseri TaxID=37863 RepID=A0A1I7Z6B6_9BILA